MFKFKIHLSQKVDGSDWKLAVYMFGNDLHIQKYTAFVRSIYHTTKREYNSKQRDQMEDYKVFDGYLSSADKGGKVL
jgi:hypothetical protein